MEKVVVKIPNEDRGREMGDKSTKKDSDIAAHDDDGPAEPRLCKVRRKAAQQLDLGWVDQDLFLFLGSGFRQLILFLFFFFYL